jgi:alanyl-tRNA synthetase
MMRRVQEMSRHVDAEREDDPVPYRVIADHARGAAFLVADGVAPGNEGRGYVLRMIIRRAARFGRRIGLDRPFLADVADEVVRAMGDAYPEVRQHQNFIREVLTGEEERFAQTVQSGLGRLEEAITSARARGHARLSGEEVFRLYDTYGFPREMTQDVAREAGLEVDWDGFEREMTRQRERARAQSAFRSAGSPAPIQMLSEASRGTEFLGYRKHAARATVLAIVSGPEAVLAAGEGEEVGVVLDRTPFHAEAGGQVGDTGVLRSRGVTVEVQDTQKPAGDVIVHFAVVRGGTLRVGDRVTAQVDTARRREIMRHHTATHLLHRALRETLGEHARQAGSLVAPDRLRFDFVHLHPLTADQKSRIERRVNEKVLEAIPVRARILPYREAVERGAMALFGEKYGDRVRMISIGDYSRELCGGTHLKSTGDVGLFRITQESSVAAGVRRVEAVAGWAAYEWVARQAALVEEVAERLRSAPGEIPARLERLQRRLRAIEREVDALQRRSAATDLDRALSGAADVEGIRVVTARFDGLGPDALRSMGDRLRARLGSGAVVVGATQDGKVALVAMVTRDLCDQIRAGDLIQPVAEIVGGSGGGRAEVAEAGGREPEKLDEALARVPDVLREMLARTGSR